MALDIVASIVAKVAGCSIAPTECHIGYLFKYKTKIGNLKEQVEKLTSARDRVHHSVDDARRKDEEIEEDVKNWFSSVDRVNEKAREIFEDEDRGKKWCQHYRGVWDGWCG